MSRWMPQIAGVLLALLPPAWAQLGGEQLGEHDMSPSSISQVKGSISSACLYCHAPHGAMSLPPLWNQQLSVQTYSMYTSSTYHQTGVQPPVSSPSKMCLSCHDGTVAPGQTVAFGRVSMTSGIKSSAIFGSDLRSSHPFSLKTPFIDTPETSALLVETPPKTADPAVKLVNGTIECTTCHDPHFQNIDKTVHQFLVRDSAKGMLCLACHDPDRAVAGQTNFLSGWAVSVHATASNATSATPYVGGYNTVAENACGSCHMPHNATGPARLTRGTDQLACGSCHSGANTLPPLLNVIAEFAKTGHPFPASNNGHDRAESTVLNNNRHATCVDCHNPHASQKTTAFNLPPTIRPSQAGVVGVSATDGTSILNPAANQYETCLRCHGESIGKASDPKYGYSPNREVSTSDPLNIIPQLNISSSSSHPVLHTRSSAQLQPSLLSQMLNLDGSTPGRAMGVQLFCTDCHNSDDNREFGGTGPNGPHGSKWTHMLERRYEMSQSATPGGTILNLFPGPDLTVNGPYALCAKCHDLSNILSDVSFSSHSKHISAVGASCSACHTAHGLGGSSPNVTGERLVNFDTNVVGPLGTTLPTYNRAAKSCTLTCHNVVHNNQTY